jgi:NTP pyrophosphatase (non-canonical NTP hydrolase)
MDSTEYQHGAHALAIYPAERDVEYVALGLASEAGEVAGKIKKQIRDGAGWTGEQREDHRRAVLDEIGDVLWYCAELCTVYGAQLGDVMRANIEKLESRQQRGVLGGSGDRR